MTYPFGQDFTYDFYPLVDDQPVAVSLALQTQVPAVYIYSFSPSRSQASTGSDSPVATIITWTWSVAKNAWQIAVTAIADPDPTGSLDVRTYYVAVNFRLKVGGQVQTIIRSLDLERVRAHHKSVSVSITDLESYIPQIGAYSTEPQRTAYLAQAITDIKGKLRNEGFEWFKIHRPDRLNGSVTLKTVAMIMLAQIQSPGDKFSLKYGEFKAMYESSIESLKMEYDADGDGVADTEVQSSTDIWVMR